MSKHLVNLLFGILFFAGDIHTIGAAGSDGLTLDQKRLNEVQYIATHNAYHISPAPGVDVLLRQNNIPLKNGGSTRELADALQYSHLPLRAQLSLGIRAFEFDLLADPEGGRFSSNNFEAILDKRNLPGLQYSDPLDHMMLPGLKVFHTPDFDQNTTCKLFVTCLQDLAEWSRENPRHFPIIVFLQPKENTAPKVDIDHEPTSVLPFGIAEWRQMSAILTNVLGREAVFSPTDLRLDGQSVVETLATKGWPTVGSLRGKFLFFYFLPEEATERFRKGMKNSPENSLFTVVWPLSSSGPFEPKPDNAMAVILDPQSPLIEEAIAMNLLVVTRADADTREARMNLGSRRDIAFSKGANLVLTDYPYRNSQFSDYSVTFSGLDQYVRSAQNASEIGVIVSSQQEGPS